MHAPRRLGNTSHEAKTGVRWNFVALTAARAVLHIPLALANTARVAVAIVLASASPRRRELLAQAGIEFLVDVSNVPEAPEENESPHEFVQRVAAEKALAVAPRHPGRVVLAADTVVVVDGVIFGKPIDREDACRMLLTLSGRSHVVLTGVALLDGVGGLQRHVEESLVTFRRLDPSEVETYLDGDEPFDKAGAYAAQGSGSQFIAALGGSRSNVIGLPMEATLELLRHHGVVARTDEPT